MKHNKNTKEIYQGEPVSFSLFVRVDGEYKPSLSDYNIEAMLYDSFLQTIRTWGTRRGDIQFSSVTVDDEIRGCATFAATGAETASWPVGDYALELAKVIEDGRVIGVQQAAISVLPARIKKGIKP